MCLRKILVYFSLEVSANARELFKGNLNVRPFFCATFALVGACVDGATLCYAISLKLSSNSRLTKHKSRRTSPQENLRRDRDRTTNSISHISPSFTDENGRSERSSSDDTSPENRSVILLTKIRNILDGHLRVIVDCLPRHPSSLIVWSPTSCSPCRAKTSSSRPTKRTSSSHYI